MPGYKERISAAAETAYEAVASVHDHVINQTSTLRGLFVDVARAPFALIGLHISKREDHGIDKLTGLPNRQSFMNALVERVRQAEANDAAHSVVVFIDLDGFKSVNDNLGHAAGDEALREAGRRLSRAFKREKDSVMRGRQRVGRLGGDEMVLLLDGRDHVDEDAIRTKIREAFSGLVYWDNNATPYPVGASIGMSVIDQDTLSLKPGSPEQRAHLFLKEADAAMYQDKAGKAARLQAARELALNQKFPGHENTIA